MQLINTISDVLMILRDYNFEDIRVSDNNYVRFKYFNDCFILEFSLENRQIRILSNIITAYDVRDYVNNDDAQDALIIAKEVLINVSMLMSKFLQAVIFSPQCDGLYIQACDKILFSNDKSVGNNIIESCNKLILARSVSFDIALAVIAGETLDKAEIQSIIGKNLTALSKKLQIESQ